jgi:hypothetical protein
MLTSNLATIFGRTAAAVLLSAALFGAPSARADGGSSGPAIPMAAPPAPPAPPAPAAPAPAAADPGAVTVVEHPARDYRILGLSIDAGAPDGAGFNLIYRPWKYVRFGGGLLYNYFGMGVSGSVTVAPYYWIAPALTLEAGKYFQSDYGAKISGASDGAKPYLKQVGYTYLNAMVGLELGAPNRFVFFVRGGLSKTSLDVHIDNSTFSTSTSDVYVKSMKDPSATLGIPAAKLGFILYLF